MDKKDKKNINQTKSAARPAKAGKRKNYGIQERWKK